MDAPERGALMLVRFVALALIGWAIVDFSLYFLLSQHKGEQMGIITCIVKFIPALIGIVALIKSKSIAQWISEKFDE